MQVTSLNQNTAYNNFHNSGVAATNAKKKESSIFGIKIKNPLSSKSSAKKEKAYEPPAWNTSPIYEQNPVGGENKLFNPQISNLLRLIDRAVESIGFKFNFNGSEKEFNVTDSERIQIAKLLENVYGQKISDHPHPAALIKTFMETLRNLCQKLGDTIPNVLASGIPVLVAKTDQNYQAKLKTTLGDEKFAIEEGFRN